MKEKEALEFYALQHFIATYNRTHSTLLRFVELRKPPEPDALCLIDGEELWIEVTHLHGSEPVDAMRNLGRWPPRNAEGSWIEKHEQETRRKSLQQRVLPKLNESLDDKANTPYSRSPVWLLVRNAFPLWNKQDFEQHIDEIAVPESHPFQHIWLLTERDGELLQLR